MSRSIGKKIMAAGLKTANSIIYHEDKIWSRYSNDKVDIGEELAKIVRVLSKALPINKTMRAFSIGSSAEPQFRILETAFLGGLYLLDVEKESLDIVKERICRQCTDHVTTVLGNYNKIFLSSKNTKKFLRAKLDGKKVELINLHHSLYYSRKTVWHTLFENLYRTILAPKGAIHAVLMASKSDDPYTTTWLYNHFVGKFFGINNDQNLIKFKKELQKNSLFSKAQIGIKTNRVRFFVDDFAKFMAVVWMILLYPNVHKYTQKQREEIVEFVYTKFWSKKKPLIQMQEHLKIYRGVNFKVE